MLVGKKNTKRSNFLKYYLYCNKKQITRRIRRKNYIIDRINTKVRDWDEKS